METMKIEADTVENAEFYANEIRVRGVKVLCCYSSESPMIYVSLESLLRIAAEK